MGRRRTCFNVGMTNPVGRREGEEGGGRRRDGRDGNNCQHTVVISGLCFV